MLWEFDIRRERLFPPDMQKKVRKNIYLLPEVVEAAQQRGLSLGDYIAHLHMNQRSIRASYVASVYRGLSLLEMARVPVDPAYFELVNGVLGEADGEKFRREASTGEPQAVHKAAANLLGADTRTSAVAAIFSTAERAGVMHEGYLEAARLLEATLYR